MKRFRGRRPAPGGVSLFPFLAVLICTMGALIVLLVLLVQLARVDASEDAEDPEDPGRVEAPDALKTQKEDYQWRREVLEKQRAQVLKKAQEKRLQLSHLEEHIRELERKWERLREIADDVKRRFQSKKMDQQDTEEELRRLRQLIAATEEQLEEARKEAANRPAMYAIVPYDGPHGTSRRPIYLECREDGVLIQPEGVRLPESYFHGPLGPGNPLDAALRAVREYHARGEPEDIQGDPYPLLLVRPDGVETFAMARSALRGWDDEFGYELVDESMQLKFPEADPTLAELLRKSIMDARSRQSVLAAAMPSRYGGDRETGFVASPTRGGFVPDAGTQQNRSPRRKGGFGRGTDHRYIDGQAKVKGEHDVTSAEAEEVEKGISKANTQGTTQGKPDASVGTGDSPLATKRGQNWALPNATDDATGIVRPLRLAVLPDRLIILPDRGERRAPEVVLIDGEMTERIDEFVSRIWDRIEGWGMAVAGGYWKPVLRVDVAQGAESRFRQLKVLLQGSGLEVRRKAP
ncbi:MAG: DUF4200 domain-containing protein [Planctomycetota bacterium]